MPILLRNLLILLVVSFWTVAVVVLADDEYDLVDYDHYDPPSEDDVEVYQACVLDANGFGGSPADSMLEVQYYQEITYEPPPQGTIVPTPQQIMRDLELATVDFLLATRRISCVRPPAVIATVATTTSNTKQEQPEVGDDKIRKLETDARHAVGLSANPDDRILELDCQEAPPVKWLNCMVVDARFSVFYTGVQEEEDGFEEGFLTEVQSGIDSGRLLEASNPQIRNIRITDPATYRPYRGPIDTTEPDIDLTPREESSLPIVLGVLIGSVLIGAAGVAYNRSQKLARQRQQAAGQQGGQDASQPTASPPGSPPASTKSEEGK
mmetsp:Transcript_34648/g.84019  ORF Transcript_34648/g.84019 Transcript_34648/m.84019 type:complete len:323 (-) Transcript_34648:232-1200(-)